MQRLQAVAKSRGGGFPGGKPPPGAGFALTGAVALLAGGWFLSNALFNVDGGHRAIKYRRISGVSKEIYSEGESGCSGPGARNMADGGANRNTFHGPVVRDAHHL